jgi:protein-S-isoprenylcysteine O-methyltransferase Ste14
VELLQPVLDVAALPVDLVDAPRRLGQVGHDEAWVVARVPAGEPDDLCLHDHPALAGAKTMTTRPESCGSPSAAQDVANLGLVRPPLVYLISLISGVVIQLATPLPFLPGTLAVPLGAPLVGVAIALFAYSVATFWAAGTPVPARKPTTKIVRAGPYRFSRNPIYLAFSLLQLGIAMWANSVWLLATLLGAVALMHYFVMRREEEYLARRFGAQYLDYKASVRRWL